MIHLLLLSVLMSAASAADQKQPELSPLASLLSSVESFLNGPVRRTPRVAAVAAVRGGIPTDQGEDLDLRLLDRARTLRDALKRPNPKAEDEKALRPVYEALSASEYVQALAVEGSRDKLAEPRTRAWNLLSKWAAEPHDRPLPPEVKTLLVGPAYQIDDKALVVAGWGKYVRKLSPEDVKLANAKPGWSAEQETAHLDEALHSVRDSLREKKFEPAAEIEAHILAGRILGALAKADLRGHSDSESAVSKVVPASAPVDEGPAPAPASDVPFDAKSIYQNAVKSVALIVCASSEGSGELGTGSVVDVARRRILTNAHVVIQDSTHQPWPTIHVYFKPAHMTGDSKIDMVDPVDGRVVAFDRALDLALVEVPSLPANAGAIALDDPRSVEVGDRVAAIGHPEQGGLWTLTTGVISTVVADVGGVPGKNAFQTDTSINRGNSGGPLLDSRGRIVGVNTSMARKAADGLAITSVNFSVRSDVAKRWMTAEGDKVDYGAAAPAASVAVNAPAPAPAAAPTPSAAPAPAAKPAPAPEHETITESKPFDFGSVIAAEVSKMEEMGDEMHKEINQKLGK
jgi:serine protease Do